MACWLKYDNDYCKFGNKEVWEELRFQYKCNFLDKYILVYQNAAVMLPKIL